MTNQIKHAMKHPGILAFAAVLAATTAAQAHTSFEIDSAAADRGFKAILQVPHGCDGKATTEVQVKLPEGFVFAKPQPKAGWTLDVIKGDYKKSYDNHGKSISSGPLEIRWKGGDLADDYYDTFVITGKISGVEEGTSLAFPVTQLCGTDASVTWDEVAKDGQNAHDLAHPAPTITVTGAPADGDAHDHNAMSMAPAADAQTVTAGALEISGGGVKAMLPGAKVGGGGLVIRNGGDADDRLLSVASLAAGRVELHEMTTVGDVMKMRPVKGGIALPAGQTVTLASGGLHLMFMDVKAPFKQGEAIPVTLTFEKAGKVDYVLKVGNVAGK